MDERRLRHLPLVRDHAAALLVLMILQGLFCPIGLADSAAPIPNPPEPTTIELLGAAELNPQDAAQLVQRLHEVLPVHPRAADAWLPLIREAEHRQLMRELVKHGYGDKFSKDWQAILPKRIEQLKSDRLQDRRRLVDALLRRLEEIGRPEDMARLLRTADWYAQTTWGKWKFYATFQGILARHNVETILRTEDLSWPTLAPLLRDLEPNQRVKIALAVSGWVEELREKHGDAAENWPAETWLWLAWSVSSAEPETAMKIYRNYLDSPDPALRLFAGMGIMRISDWQIPFRLTASPEESERAREEWLASRTLHTADDWRFPDPLLRPVIKEQRGGRIDLLWLSTDGSIARQTTDVWPQVRQVSFDGSFYSTVPTSSHHVLVMTAPDGEVLTRMGEIDHSVGGDFLACHGGTWNLRKDTREAVELAPDGITLWSHPTSETNVSARFIASAGPGQILLLRYGKLEIINRRGDVLWSLQGEMDDPRWACMIGPETVLVSCTNEIQIRHRTQGLLSRVGGFKSLGPVRYHPEEPWIIFDQGSQEVILYSPKPETRISRRIGWTNSDPSIPSRWLKASGG